MLYKTKNKDEKKTELCKNWAIYHDCYFKDECSFAHGMDELRLDNHISGLPRKRILHFWKEMQF
jgi:hypothetical protein